MLIYGEYECFVMQILYAFVLYASCGSSQCYILHDLPFLISVEDASGDYIKQAYSRAGLMTAL